MWSWLATYAVPVQHSPTQHTVLLLDFYVQSKIYVSLNTKMLVGVGLALSTSLCML